MTKPHIAMFPSSMQIIVYDSLRIASYMHGNLSFRVDETNANTETLAAVGGAIKADRVIGVPQLFESHVHLL